jgi:putative tricarboxylic transport membrane protein
MIMNLFVAVGFLLFSAWMFFEAGRFPVSRATAVGPEFWPQIVMGGMFVFSALLVIGTVIYRRQYAAESLQEKQPYPHNFWLVLGYTAAYVAGMEWIGFVVATILFLGALFWILKFRQTKPLLLVIFGSTLFSVLLFPRLLGIPLPRGTGLFRTISLFFY